MQKEARAEEYEQRAQEADRFAQEARDLEVKRAWEVIAADWRAAATAARRHAHVD
jgi:hypothetical protein